MFNLTTTVCKRFFGFYSIPVGPTYLPEIANDSSQLHCNGATNALLIFIASGWVTYQALVNYYLSVTIFGM